MRKAIAAAAALVGLTACIPSPWASGTYTTTYQGYRTSGYYEAVQKPDSNGDGRFRSWAWCENPSHTAGNYALGTMRDINNQVADHQEPVAGGSVGVWRSNVKCSPPNFVIMGVSVTFCATEPGSC